MKTNYIGDIGDTCIGPGGTLSFSFRVPADGQYVLVLRGSAPSQLPYYRVTLANSPPTAVVLRSASAARTSRGIVVRWRTAVEDHLLGFNLYRVQRGKSVRLNRVLIPGVFAGTTRGHSYSRLDPFAPRTGPLRYRLQEVRLDGTRSWLDSVMVGS